MTRMSIVLGGRYAATCEKSESNQMSCIVVVELCKLHRVAQGVLCLVSCFEWSAS